MEKTGWGLGGSVFASIVGFCSIYFISTFLQTNSPLLNVLFFKILNYLN